MGTNILGIGQSALAAAQLGIATAGHNIANANTPGYSRQTLLQSAAEPQNSGGTFIGQGTRVGDVRRVYNQFITQQVNTSQSTQNYSSAYLSQIQQISNLVADPSAGVSPSLQEFFSSIQNLASSPNGTAGAAARQSVVSNASSLVSRFQSLQGRLDQVEGAVNEGISQTVTDINGFASEISKLNDAIEIVQSQSGGATPNDLLDQRDYAVTQLSKLVNVSVVEQGGKLNVFIGTGQPLVLGNKVSNLQATVSSTDPGRAEVSYEGNGTLIELSEKSLGGGSLGGLFAFRSGSLDVAKNSLGRVAISVATEFNNQHKLGQDINGQPGVDFFSVGQPIATASTNNTSAANIAATFADTSALTLSDYRVQYLAGVGPAPNYFKITRVSDGSVQTSTTLPAVIDGVSFNLALNSALPPVAVVPNVNDEFLVRPTANGASSIRVDVSDVAKVAAGTSLTTSLPSTNLGTGKITSGTLTSLVSATSNSTNANIGSVNVDDSYVGSTLAAPLPLTFVAGNRLSGFPDGSTVSVTVGGVTTNYDIQTPVPTLPKVADIPYTSGAKISYGGVNFVVKDNPAAPTVGDTFTLANSLPVTPTKLTYNSAGNNFTGFPATANVTVKNGNTTTSYSAGAAIPYIEGSTVSFNGQSFVVSGAYANGDVINIASNPNGTGDNRNAGLLGALQTKNLVAGGTTSFQGAYAQFVSAVGNKTHELETNYASDTKLLKQAEAAQQSESGVNLDEEATNLLRYQQAYQAAGKLMQIASSLFDQLLAIGR
ncbi:MAG: flagellar hook-associated protein FlgK [Undibacterium sp.]|nr:flagellar hook-associated protein FlgK [Undibacterium sp.]